MVSPRPPRECTHAESPASSGNVPRLGALAINVLLGRMLQPPLAGGPMVNTKLAEASGSEKTASKRQNTSLSSRPAAHDALNPRNFCQWMQRVKWEQKSAATHSPKQQGTCTYLQHWTGTVQSRHSSKGTGSQLTWQRDKACR